MKAVIAVMPVMPSADAEQRGEDRQAGGDQRAEGQDEDEQRDARCRSARRRRRARPSPDMPEPLASTVRPASRASRQRVVQRVLGGRLDVGDGVHVEVEGDHADPAVLGERRAAPGRSASACAGGRAVSRRPARPSASSCSGAAVDRVGQRRRRRASAGASARSATRSSTAVGVRRLVERVPLGRGDDDVDGGLVEGVDGARGRARPGGRRPSPTGCPGSRTRRSSAWTCVRGDGADGDHGDQPAGEEERPAPVGGLAESVEQGGHGEVSPGGRWMGAGQGWVRRGGRGRCAGSSTYSSASGRWRRGRRGRRRGAVSNSADAGRRTAAGRAAASKAGPSRSSTQLGELALDDALEALVGRGQQPGLA